MSARLVETHKAQPYNIERGNIHSYSVASENGRRVSRLYTGNSGENRVSTLPGRMIFWGKDAFTAAADIASAEQTPLLEKVKRMPIGLPAEVHFTNVGFGGVWQEVAHIGPNTPDMSEQAGKLQEQLGGNRNQLNYVLLASPDGVSLPQLFIGQDTLQHKEIINNERPAGVLDAGYITITQDAVASYNVLVGEQSSNSRIGSGGRAARQVVGETIASVIQLTDINAHAISVQLASPGGQDWGMVTLKR